jgi:signal peptidase II
MRLAAPKLFYRMCGLSAAVVLLDQVSKLLVFRVLMEDRAEIAVLPVFRLVKWYNTGISFSFFSTDHALGAWVFALLAIIIAFGLLIWLSQTADRLPAVGLALVIGGAIGNVIDRVREGAVIGDGFPAVPLEGVGLAGLQSRRYRHQHRGCAAHLRRHVRRQETRLKAVCFQFLSRAEGRVVCARGSR